MGGGVERQQSAEEARSADADADDALLGALLTHPAAMTALLDRLDSSAVASDPRWAGVLTHPHFAHARDEVSSRSLEHLYAVFGERHHLLWRPDLTLAWLLRGAARAVAAADAPTSPITSDGLCAADFAAMRAETFPGSSSNAYAHLAVSDFSDVVKRQMPEGDENPFLQPPPRAGALGGDVAFDPADLVGMLQDVEAEAGGALPGFEDAAARIQQMGPEEAAEFHNRLFAAMEARADGGGGDGGGDLPVGAAGLNPLLEFFRTMFVQDPADRGGALRRQMRRQNAAPGAAPPDLDPNAAAAADRRPHDE